MEQARSFAAPHPPRASHTKGPWIAAASKSSVVGLPVVAQSGRSIANVTFFDLGEPFKRHNEESYANARLIAAAPDLLHLWDDYPAHQQGESSSDYAARLTVWAFNIGDTARAALSKAEG